MNYENYNGIVDFHNIRFSIHKSSIPFDLLMH